MFLFLCSAFALFSLFVQVSFEPFSARDSSRCGENSRSLDLLVCCKCFGSFCRFQYLLRPSYGFSFFFDSHHIFFFFTPQLKLKMIRKAKRVQYLLIHNFSVDSKELYLLFQYSSTAFKLIAQGRRFKLQYHTASLFIQLVTLAYYVK